MVNIPVYTTKLTNTNPNIKLLGLVIGTDIERVSFARSEADDLLTTFGGSSGIVRKKMNDLVAMAMKDLQKNIAEEFPEATAVYNAKLFFNTMDGKRRFAINALTLGAEIGVAIASDGEATSLAKLAGNSVNGSNTTEYELVITGTAVIEKKSKTRRSPRRRN
jgi:uncharacterized protein YbjQ (UPF0145 family)